ncbi:sugar phosphate isomerase/epimerase [Candidatus Micrarchaeota archaeon]|nr:sugar phosphate isomerase/epimerase [Candidatus Micrarchaeota archaeon]MBU1930104.1 sugar phosphate isomerase/epimerase [Candidatus Micrarchaeota archaeon]
MSLPKSVFFLTDFYSAKKEQIEPRLKIARYANELGFEQFGGEFLFINPNDVQNLKEQKKYGIKVKEKLDSLFDHTYFSLHAPWFPPDKTAFEMGKKPFENVQALLDFCPEFVEIINVHTGTIPFEYWDQKLKNNPQQKQKNLEIVKQQLEKLADTDDRICVENLYTPVNKKYGTNYLANLPSDLAKMSENPKIGITIDTAHAGMTIESCKRMVQNQKLFNGFFENEWNEIQSIAKNGPKEFTDLGEKIRHIHFSDFNFNTSTIPKSTEDGAVPGLGVTPKKELFEWLEKLVIASEKKKIGVTLEIKEKKYDCLKNQEKTLEIIASHYGIEKN